MGKLVRDRIPEIIREAGHEPEIRVLDSDAYVTSLLAKALEEVQELIDASPERRLEEAADVYEVLLALLATSNQGLDDLNSAAQAKREHRGAFTQKYWLE